MSTNFRAFVVNQTADGFKMGIERLNQRDLPPGDVLIQVAYSSVNYKSVLASDFGSTQGVSRHGGYSEYARVPGDFLFRLPEGLDYKQALVLTAGMTAAMGLRQLEKNGLTPQMGPILVTGASGGWGVWPSAFYQDEATRWLQAQASQTWLSATDRPLEAERGLEHRHRRRGHPGLPDANDEKRGAIAAIGVAGGAAFRATVYPLILRESRCWASICHRHRWRCAGSYGKR